MKAVPWRAPANAVPWKAPMKAISKAPVKAP
jgi:hypothetical protein